MYPQGTSYATGGKDNGPVGMSGTQSTGTNGMKYIPTLYAGKLLVKFYEASVLSDIANTDYEGQIKDQGDTVIIRTLPTITVRSHTKGMTLTPEVPTSESVILLIDKGLYWNFQTDDPDSVQTDIKSFVNDWTSEASYELRNAIEQNVLQTAVIDAGHKGENQGAQSAAFNLGKAGAPVAFSAATAIDTMIDCGTVLDESSVPDDGRFFLLPPRLVGCIKKSELKDASKTGDATSVVRNGLIGMIDRFKVFRTGNLLYTTADKAWSCMFGTKHAITFASQLVKSQTIDNPTGFGLLHRGLQVYGFKVVKPEALGVLYAAAS